MSIFVTSDPHYGHKKIIEYCNRPFSSVEEMDEKLIKNHNSVVSADDTIIFNGDFMFYKKDTGIFHRLNGRKILVLGNHDHEATTNLPWEEIHSLYEFSYSKRTFIMCHYPIEKWHWAESGSIHLYGHVHDERQAPVSKIKNRHNICVEMTGYTPVNIENFL